MSSLIRRMSTSVKPVAVYRLLENNVVCNKSTPFVVESLVNNPLLSMNTIVTKTVGETTTVHAVNTLPEFTTNSEYLKRFPVMESEQLLFNLNEKIDKMTEKIDKSNSNAYLCLISIIFYGTLNMAF